ncbi:MAG: flavodoxin-dependent (E)-4-hydroxy-3-methylbut-2-enyl-diphosphate synthase [Lactimicrobium sp.]|jgi:(E)-4-hydroxy-3-methylbut-2-enyl-diphosphate synthase|uniref:flavodoxin-dependent (E)-4-hydroxy-3-methylbut-2-enyl-diphosphate synthase n=1 Tax=Lactimicrobium sp. TaxID=2563780 RepID=UPI002F351CF6
MKRTETRKIMVGNVQVGGQNRCILQSMTNVPAKNIKATIAQINELEEHGCEIIRIAVLDEEDAKAIPAIRKGIHIPLVADIHFNYLLALAALDGGVDAIRINPGNIGSREHTEAVVRKCKEKHVPIRIGINGGSLEKQYLEKYGLSAEAMIASADRHVKILEDMDFHDICLSFKSSNVELTIAAYELAAKHYPYPLHLGVTEAGGFTESAVKSSAALGTLLHEGIGDTIRVSVSAPPKDELIIGKQLLKCFGLIKNVPDLIACPTCGRIQYDMLPLVKEMEDYLSTVHEDITVAIMGCPVNGIQEAGRADIGIAGSYNSGILFRNGEIIRTVPQDKIKEALIEEIQRFIAEKKQKNQ